jgi:hypothetical protein
VRDGEDALRLSPRRASPRRPASQQLRTEGGRQRQHRDEIAILPKQPDATIITIAAAMTV